MKPNSGRPTWLRPSTASTGSQIHQAHVVRFDFRVSNPKSTNHGSNRGNGLGGRGPNSLGLILGQAANVLLAWI